MYAKKTVAVIFGGRSSEHEVSCASAILMLHALDQEKYQVLPVGITKQGQWLIYTGPAEHIKNGEWEKFGTPVCLSPDATKKCFLKIVGSNVKEIPVDVVIPVLHGAWGEDGTIQGLLEMAQIPYVGCGVLSSAVCMDKFYTKIIVADAGIRQAKFVGIRRSEIRNETGLNNVLDRIEDRLSYPVFIKPSQAGSSVGVTKASSRSEVIDGLRRAAEVDAKILVEEFIKGREVECAVFGGGEDNTVASGVGEILAAADFYDYDAKYNNPESKTVMDPDLPSEVVETIRKYAVEIFTAVDGYGLARVDFFVAENNEVIFNEINTMPGFTAISMYPMLWEKRGVSKKELIAKLIESALKREQH